jgi:multiple sugar transport system permease protein
MVTLGVVTDLVRGDVFFWGSLMAGALFVAVPVAIAYNFMMDTFVRGITGGALK